MIAINRCETVNSMSQKTNVGTLTGTLPFCLNIFASVTGHFTYLKYTSSIMYSLYFFVSSTSKLQ